MRVTLSTCRRVRARASSQKNRRKISTQTNSQRGTTSVQYCSYSMPNLFFRKIGSSKNTTTTRIIISNTRRRFRYTATAMLFLIEDRPAVDHSGHTDIHRISRVSDKNRPRRTSFFGRIDWRGSPKKKLVLAPQMPRPRCSKKASRGSGHPIRVDTRNDFAVQVYGFDIAQRGRDSGKAALVEAGL